MSRGTCGVQGIGLEISKELGKQGLTLVCTARNAAAGQEAVEKIAAVQGGWGDVWGRFSGNQCRQQQGRRGFRQQGQALVCS